MAFGPSAATFDEIDDGIGLVKINEDEEAPSAVDVSELLMDSPDNQESAENEDMKVEEGIRTGQDIVVMDGQMSKNSSMKKRQETKTQLSFSFAKGVWKNEVSLRVQDFAISNIKGLTFEAKPGTLSMMVGPSGVGKSTMMRALAGRTPTSYDGHVSTASLRQLLDPSSEVIAFVEQFPSFLPNVKARDVVDVVLDLVSDRVRNRGVEDALESHARSCERELGVDSFAETRVKWLSGGEQKRLAILLSLISCPGVLFLDEPVSGLSQDMAKIVIKALRGAADKVGTTIILSIHQPSSDILALADNIIEIDNEGNATCSKTGRDALVDAENNSSYSTRQSSGDNCIKHTVNLRDWPDVAFWPADSMAPLRLSRLLLTNRLRSPTSMPLTGSIYKFVLVSICGLLYKGVPLDHIAHLTELIVKNTFLIGLAVSTSIGWATAAASDYQFAVQHIFDGQTDIISCITGLYVTALANTLPEAVSLTLAAALTDLIDWSDFGTSFLLFFGLQFSFFAILMPICTRVFVNASCERSDMLQKCVSIESILLFLSGWPIDIYSLYKPLRWLILINPFYYSFQSLIWLDLHNEQLKCERSSDITNYNVGQVRRALRSKNGESLSLDTSGLLSYVVGTYANNIFRDLYGGSGIQTSSCDVDGDDVYSSLRLGRMNNSMATRRNIFIVFIIGAVSTILLPFCVALRLSLLRVRRTSIKSRLRRWRLASLIPLVGLCLLSRYRIDLSDPHAWLPKSPSKIDYDTQLAELAPNVPGRIDCDTAPSTAIARFLGDPIIGTTFQPKGTDSIFAQLPTLDPPVTDVETRKSCCSRSFQSFDEMLSYYPESLHHFRNIDEVMSAFYDDSGESLVLSLAMNTHTSLSSTFFYLLDAGAETLIFLRDEFPVLSSSAVANAFAAHNTSVSSAIADGRVFITNLTILEEAQMKPGYTIKAPYALHYLRDDGKYETIAIQFGADPNLHSVLTRNSLDHVEQWLTARYALRHAIFTMGRIAHIVQNHYFLMAIRTAQINQLSEHHPVRVVLEPLLQNILGLTCVTQQAGLLLSGLSIAGMLFDNNLLDEYLTGNKLMGEATARPFIYYNHPLQTSLARTSAEVERRSPDPQFPSFKTNITAIWEITLEFMQSYLDLHYADDESVANDKEVQSFIAEIITDSIDGGGGAGPLAPTANNAKTRANLAEILCTMHFANLVHGFHRIPSFAHNYLETMVNPPALRDFNLLTITSLDAMLTQVFPKTEEVNMWFDFYSYLADAPHVQSLWTLESFIDLGVGAPSNQAFFTYNRRLFQHGYRGELKVESGVSI